MGGLFVFGSFKYRIDKNALTYGALIVIAATFWTSWWPRSALNSQMAGEENRFSIDDVLDRLSSKLINRHPHVFGDVKADTSDEVKRNWEALKLEERKQKEGSEEAGAKSEKRSILASWASDAAAVTSNPALRELAGTRRIVTIDEILEALSMLDHKPSGPPGGKPMRQKSTSRVALAA